ncbi:hypothetical protein EAY42_22825 [Vibrio anguillarum]|nr:hypothetical protein [Vibrio anguillarum]MBF4337945.1 hypothetical protein [Vibrio anguillarum]
MLRQHKQNQKVVAGLSIPSKTLLIGPLPPILDSGGALCFCKDLNLIAMKASRVSLFELLTKMDMMMFIAS